MNFYENLEKELEKKNITTYRLCKEVGLKTSTLGNYKNGVIPKIDIVEKIALYLGIRTDDLIIGKETKTKDDKIIEAYYAASPGTREAVRKLLDINEQEENQEKSSSLKIG